MKPLYQQRSFTVSLRDVDAWSRSVQQRHISTNGEKWLPTLSTYDTGMLRLTAQLVCVCVGGGGNLWEMNENMFFNSFIHCAAHTQCFKHLTLSGQTVPVIYSLLSLQDSAF